MQNAATTRILSGPDAERLSKGVWKGKRRGRREEVERSLRKTMRIRRPSCRCAEPQSILTTTRRGLYHRPHFADEKSEPQRGEVTGPRRNGRVREAGFGNSEAAGLRQHPKRRGLRPSHRSDPRPPGRGVRKSPSGRHGPPAPVPRASPAVRAALGSSGPPAPASPAPAGRPGQVQPAARAREGSRRRAVGVAADRGGDRRGERLGEGAPGDGHAPLTRRTCCSSSRRRHRLTE